MPIRVKPSKPVELWFFLSFSVREEVPEGRMRE